MRLFIAVDINLRSKDLIEKKVDILKEEYDDQFKWVKKENWHLTLEFIGEASEDEKADLIEVLKNINFKAHNEYIQFSQLGAFPDLKQAKVLYLALKQGKDILKELNERLGKELFKYGFESDQREYIPHLTLGRNKSEAIKIKKDHLKNNFINIYAQIEGISLYKSELKAEGPEYIKLFSI